MGGVLGAPGRDAPTPAAVTTDVPRCHPVSLGHRLILTAAALRCFSTSAPAAPQMPQPPGAQPRRPPTGEAVGALGGASAVPLLVFREGGIRGDLWGFSGPPRAPCLWFQGQSPSRRSLHITSVQSTSFQDSGNVCFKNIGRPPKIRRNTWKLLQIRASWLAVFPLA